MRSTPAFCTASRLEAERRWARRRGAACDRHQQKCGGGDQAMRRSEGDVGKVHGDLREVGGWEALLCACLAPEQTPRRIWSSSMLSNSALKLPSPKPSSPLRWMNSKKIGPELVLAEDLQQQRALLAVDQDLALLQLGHVFAVARDALVDQLVVGVDGVQQLHAAAAQRIHRVRTGRASPARCAGCLRRGTCPGTPGSGRPSRCPLR